jgi:hypothetical protein
MVHCALALRLGLSIDFVDILEGVCAMRLRSRWRYGLIRRAVVSVAMSSVRLEGLKLKTADYLS